MRSTFKWTIVVIAVGILAGCGGGGDDNKNRTSFFVTSVGPGNGANLGGLAGGDRQCQALATAVGAGSRTWRAYLSQQPTSTLPSVNARDRIGKGPWQNVNGVVVATDVDALHTANNIVKATALTEKGAVVNGRTDTPNIHDMLTGSQSDGRVIPGSADTTCGNWTQSGTGAAMLGHSDNSGPGQNLPAESWNSSHLSAGCSAAALTSTAGAGLFYCFAAD